MLHLSHSGSTTALHPGDTVTLTVWADGWPIRQLDAVWSSSDPTRGEVEVMPGHALLRGRTKGPVTVTARLGDGVTLTREFHVVDPDCVAWLRLELRKDEHPPGRFSFQCTAGFAHGYSRDVTNDHRVVWSTTAPEVASWGEADGVLSGHRDGDVTAGAELRGKRATVDLHLVSGVAARITSFSTPHATLVQGIRESLRVHVERSAQRTALGTAPGVQITAEPADAVRIEHHTEAVLVTGLRPGPAQLEARLGTQRFFHVVEVVDLPVELSPIDADLSFRTAGTHVLWIGERGSVRVGLSCARGMLDPEHNVVWTSSDPEVLLVEATKYGHEVVAGHAGTAVLRVACPARGLSQELEVQVNEKPEIQWF